MWSWGFTTSLCPCGFLLPFFSMYFSLYPSQRTSNWPAVSYSGHMYFTHVHVLTIARRVYLTHRWHLTRECELVSTLDVGLQFRILGNWDTCSHFDVTVVNYQTSKMKKKIKATWKILYDSYNWCISVCELLEYCSSHPEASNTTKNKRNGRNWLLTIITTEGKIHKWQDNHCIRTYLYQHINVFHGCKLNK